MGLLTWFRKNKNKHLREKYGLPNNDTAMGQHNRMLWLSAKPQPYMVVDRDGDVVEVFTARNNHDAIKMMQERCSERAYPPYRLFKVDVVAELKPTTAMQLEVNEDHLSGERPWE